jgi:tRNA (cytidine/uridine-2'-O-)-methyltransferase
MIHLVLVNPEIPPNTGNIIRLCANTGYYLHLIKPLGFDLDNRNLVRAGLDYHDLVLLKVHETLEIFIQDIRPNRILATTAHTKKLYTDIKFNKNDAILFGPESKGLNKSVIDIISTNNIFKLPMIQNSRSLNLSNAVSIIAYESWKQLNFEGSI